MYYPTTVNIDTVRDQYYFFFYLQDFLKYWQNVPLYIEQQWYSYFCHISDWSIFYQFFSKKSNLCYLCINVSHKFWIRAVFVFSVTIFWGIQRNIYLLYLDIDIQNHPSFSICLSSGKKTHFNVYQQSKFNYTHHLFFQNTFNLSSRCEQVSTRIEAYYKSNLFSCYFLVKTHKSVQPIALQQYILYIGVDWL